MKGYLSLILHAHLPYVRHPEENHFLEEKWFYEAVTETYVPVMSCLKNLINDGYQFELTLSLSPTLLAMMSDHMLQERYRNYLNNLIVLAEKETHRTAGNTSFEPLSHMYLNRLKKIKSEYEKAGTLINGFKKLNETGRLKLITTAATHSYFPLHMEHEQSIKAQVYTGLKEFERHFGYFPEGFWLPECGYYPSLENILNEFGLKYFILESHGILHASPQPRYGLYAPVYCPGGVAAFGRDIESSKQVWSSNEGYPGDYNYREFYRDIGYDLSEQQLEPFQGNSGLQCHTGIKYYKITGADTELKDKEPYIPHLAQKKAREHAENFIFNRDKQLEHLTKHMDREPLIVCPYDAELFGHWWYEGPDWLDNLIRKNDQYNNLELISPETYLEKYPVNQISTPPMSSWGYKGYNDVWLEDSNDWIYPHLHMACDRMQKLVNSFKIEDLNGQNKQIDNSINQAARELMLAQSSDWPFIMKTDTMVEYAEKRFKEHISNFNTLYKNIRDFEMEKLKTNTDKLSEKNNLFPEIDYRIYKQDMNEVKKPNYQTFK